MTNPTTDLAARFEAKREEPKGFTFGQPQRGAMHEVLRQLGASAIRSQRITDHEAANAAQRRCMGDIETLVTASLAAQASGGWSWDEVGDRLRSCSIHSIAGGEPERYLIKIGCPDIQTMQAVRDGMVSLREGVPEARDMARAGAAGGADWTCAARRQGTAGGNDPADCDWPVCGCDPYADKVVAALQESGHLAPPPPAQQGSSSPPLTAERVDWTCAARRQGTAGGNDPADCDWPVCGCDPYADKIIAALQEAGRLVPASLPAGTGSADEGTDLDGTFQERNAAWMEEAFAGDPTDLPERVARFGEEALELQQALGQSREDAHRLVDYVYSRPIGRADKEMGGTLTTLACLAVATGIDMATCGEDELARVSTPAFIAKLRGKRATRHGRGPLPGFSAPGTSEPTPDPVGEAKALLEGLCYGREPKAQAEWLRIIAEEWSPRSPQRRDYLRTVEAIEAALATLHASQDQAGEVR